MADNFTNREYGILAADITGLESLCTCNDLTVPILTKTVGIEDSVLRYDLYKGILCREEICIESYSISVCEFGASFSECRLLYDVCEDVSEAVNIVNVLSSQGVSPLHVADVIEEFI